MNPASKAPLSLYLNTAQKKAILDLVKNRMQTDYHNNAIQMGICGYIRTAIFNVYNVFLRYDELSTLFPHLNARCADEVVGVDHRAVLKPGKGILSAWWSLYPYNYDSRIAFLNYLISTLYKPR